MKNKEFNLLVGSFLSCSDCIHTVYWKEMAACTQGQWILDHQEDCYWIAQCPYFEMEDDDCLNKALIYLWEELDELENGDVNDEQEDILDNSSRRQKKKLIIKKFKESKK